MRHSSIAAAALASAMAIAPLGACSSEGGPSTMNEPGPGGGDMTPADGSMQPAQSYYLSSAQIITGEAKDTYNDFGQPERVNIQPLAAENVEACGRSLSVTLPSKSVVMLRLLPVPQL